MNPITHDSQRAVVPKSEFRWTRLCVPEIAFFPNRPNDRPGPFFEMRLDTRII